MNLKSYKNPRTDDMVLVLTISSHDMTNAKRTAMDEVFLEYLEENQSISHVLLSAAIIAREVERGYSEKSRRKVAVK